MAHEEYQNCIFPVRNTMQSGNSDVASMAQSNSQINSIDMLWTHLVLELVKYFMMCALQMIVFGFMHHKITQELIHFRHNF